MEKVLFLLIVLMSHFSSASICSPFLKESAVDLLSKVVSMHNSGIAAQTDVDLAKKLIIEADLCDNPLDVVALSDLVKNIKSRLDSKKFAFENGLVESAAVEAVSTELTSFYSLCKATYEPLAAERFKNGILSAAELKILMTSCRR